jgi:hypothetical protein
MRTNQKVRPDLLGLQHGEPRDFRLLHPLTCLCSHLANGGKHFYIRDRKLKAVDRAVLELRGWVEDGWVEDGWVAKEPTLVVHATSKEQAELGWDTPDRDALWLAAKVLKFWRNFPALQSTTEAPPP